MNVETVKFTTEVRIADADDKPIRVGSVMKEINDGERGVVIRIVRAGDMGTAFDAIGDLHIYKRPGITRVTNRYNQWRHIPHNEQTYEERLTSWLITPYDHDTESSVPKDEQIACSGIMALLPDNIVNDDYGPWPDRIEDALRYLVEHLSNAECVKGEK